MIKTLLISVLLLTTQIVTAMETDSVNVVNKDSIFTIQPSSSNTLDFLNEPSDILTEGMILPPTAAGDSIQFYINQAQAAIEKIRKLNNWIQNIDEATHFELPVGIKREVGNISYELAIQAIRLKPGYAELDVFLQFDVPQNSQPLTFMAKNIKFTKKGGIVGDAALVLLGDRAINLNGDKSQIVLKANDTYATIDCDGFKELGIGADIKFSRDLIRPENPDGSVAEGNVMASFNTKLSNWNDFIVQLTLPDFQMTGLPGVSFNAQDAVFDFSDVRNAPAVEFPEGYRSTLMLPDNPNLWRGFYLRQLTITLPPEFKKRGSSTRTTFDANDVIIDNMGITGKFGASGLMTMQEGDMNGWAFSLEELHVEIQTNQLVEAGFKGGIVIPIGKEDTPFEYSAIINTGGNYLFSVSPTKDIQFEVFKTSKVEIYEASNLEIAVVDHQFFPKANLHGRMSIQAGLSEGGKGIELADISFENLQIQSVKPYIQVGNFSFGSEALQQKMAGFPVSIQDIGMRNLSATQVGLDFRLKLNLVGEESGAFAADAGLTMVGQMNADKGWQSWKYKDIQVQDIAVDIDGGAFKFNGKLVFYRNDVAYGDGFNGSVKAEFKPGIKVTAAAIFGNVNGMRYWYADAMANLPTGIPIFTGVGIYGFGGGAYYRMKMDTQGKGSALGMTPSGIVYVPDEKSGLGLKAVVALGSHPKPEAFNADVTFEISFFKGGGVRYISFQGNGYLVTPGLDMNLDKLKATTGKMAQQVKNVASTMSSVTGGNVGVDGGDANSLKEIFGDIGEKAGKKGQISAHVGISYDFENRVLHGNFEMYINVAGGIIKGVGAGGRAGWAVLHFAPHEWYIYVGTPDDRIGISVGVGSIRANATSYFMVGTKILGSPPPPKEVAQILHMEEADLDYMSDLNSIGRGAGFAFGAALSVSTGDLSFLMFYARFDAGAGFDIMLKNYGDARCVGSSDRIGINGWYANGQAYAYFRGSIGIRIKLFTVRKKIEILSIGAAAILQAKLPNPFWMRGIVGGEFSVLGGLVHGNCKFQVTLGEECIIVRDPNAVLDDIQVIADLTPAEAETDVNVFTTPQAVFNLQVDTNFELYDDASNTKRTFRAHLDHFKAEVDKKTVTATFQWNDNKDVLALNPYEILPPQKEVLLSVQVSFEEYVNGVWKVVRTDGVPVVQNMVHKITTGTAPDYIPVSNIEYAYPIIGQFNFYKSESPNGYIKLKRAQPYLFGPPAEWRQEGRFKSQEGNVSSFDYTYTYSTNLIEYRIPSGLINGKVYTLDFVNVPINKSQDIDRNVSSVATKVGDQPDLNIQVSTKNVEGSIEELQEKSILKYALRTSRYNTFSEKIDRLTIPRPFQWETANGVTKLYSNIANEELFDKFETDPSRSVSTILMEAIPDNRWYTSTIYPLLYEGYPIDGRISITNRDVSKLGVPPVRAVYFLNQSDNAIDQNNPGNVIPFGSTASLQYYFPVETGNDYLIMRAIAANLAAGGSNTIRINNLLMATWKNVFPDDYYRVKVSYVLPGTRKVTSEKIIPLYFTINRN